MEIRKLDTGFNTKYLTLCETKGSIFNSFEWLTIYQDALEIFGIFNDDNKLIGGFYLFKTKLAGVLTHYKNPPFTPHIGLFFDNQTGNKANSLSFEKNLANCLAHFLDKLPFQIITLSLPDKFCDAQPFIWKKFKVIPNYTYQLNLENSEAELLKNISGDKRNSINKASKDKVSVIACTDMKVVKQMVEKTYTRKAKTLNEKILNSILFDFSNTQNSYAYVALVDNQPAALCFCIHDASTAYYLLGGYDSKNKHQGAGVLALWNCVLHAKKTGLKKFDFEGSMIPEIEKYFRGFGGDLVPYFTLNKANILVESVLKFIKRESF